MTKHSAGILSFRFRDGEMEVLLAHPGGPLWANRDDGAWTIPKGLVEANESCLDAAKREFEEEVGFEPKGNFLDLGEIKQPSGKVIHIWALEGNFDVAKFKSNMFEMEWPIHSGKIREYPEIDKVGWFKLKDAEKKILKGQIDFIKRLKEVLKIA
ncbi:MAG: NUDIX domain-containing protein [Candidatus Micrarchaeia archaeon]